MDNHDGAARRPRIARAGRALIFLIALAMLAIPLASARAQTLNPTAFTAAFARALADRIPGSGVAVRGDLKLALTRPGGREALIALDNAYRDYRGDPARLNEIVATYVAGIAAPASAGKLDRSRVVPVIKDREWIEETRAELAKRGATTVPQHKVENFNKELIIVYAEDDPQRTRYLDVAEDVGATGAELRALAIANLKRILPKITLESIAGSELFQLSAGGDYDASLLLIDDIWSSGQIKVDGDIVVAIPARNVLLVTGSRSRKGLKAVRAIVEEAMKDSRRLTDTLFVYRKGRFVRFGRS